MQNKYDVIVIGSGIGGLTAAGLLSSTKKVLVLEGNSGFGGYCTSFRRKKFTFESAIHAINNCKEKYFAHSILEKCGVVRKIKFLQHNNLYKAIFPKHSIIVPQEDPGSYINILVGHFPRERVGILELFKAMHKIYIEVERINKTKVLMKSPNLINSTKISFKNMMDKYIDSEELKAIISQYWLYCGLPPSRLSPIHFSYICQDYLNKGAYCVEGGVQRVIDSLVHEIRQRKSVVNNNSEVTKIIVKNGVAIGVETKNGNIFYGDFIISGVDAKYTFENLTEENDRIKICLKQMKDTEPSISCFRVYLGLDIDVKKLGISDYEIFLNYSYDLDKDYNNLIENRADKAPFGVCIHSNVDPSVCESNKTVVAITMLSGYDYWEKLNAKEYKENKTRIANILIKKAEEAIPHISKYIEMKVMATPLTMKRYTGNNSGAAYGWSRNVFFYGSKHMNIQTPINNLYLASNWTKIGGGVEGVMRSAERAYDLIVNDHKR